MEMSGPCFESELLYFFCAHSIVCHDCLWFYFAHGLFKKSAILERPCEKIELEGKTGKKTELG